jgi:acetyltransferase
MGQAATLQASSTDNLERRRSENLRRLFNPKSIAVIGASADAAKAGSQALLSLRNFSGKVMGVHPRETMLHGYPCHPDVESLPEAVDLAILAIPAASCVDVVARLARRGAGGVFIISGGFGETGDAGAKHEAELATICAETGIRLLGPNTSGFVAPHVPLIASFVPGVEQLKPGRVAVIAQSGGVNLSLAFLLDHLGEGVALAAGLGNAIDIRSTDMLAMLTEDENTAAIALHLEGVPDGRRLYDTLRWVTPKKPVVALVAGRADIGDFAVSHTGNLLGSRQRTVSALRQAGVVVVDTTEQLAQAAVTLSYMRLRPKATTNVALITGQAGPGLLIADDLKSNGLDMPVLRPDTIAALQKLLPPMTYVSNPIDTGRPGPTFPDVVRTVVEDRQIDTVLVFGLSEPSVLDPTAALKPALATGKPIAFGTLGTLADLEAPLSELRAEGILGLVGPERLALVAVSLATDAKGQHLLARTDGAVEVKQPLSGPFDENSAKELLSSYGVRSPKRTIVTTREAAKAAFDGMAKPVVAKIAASDIAHKTEVGGVIVGIIDERQLDAALDKIAAIPTKDRGKVLLEEMAGEGIELIVGGVRDPSWGPMVMIGLGGIFAEALNDTSLRLAPVTAEQAIDMLNDLRAKVVLDGFRGIAPVDKQALADVIIAVGNLLVEHPEIAEIEINPLRVSTAGTLALDALISIEPSSRHALPDGPARTYSRA